MATPSPPTPLLFAVRKADSVLDAFGSSKTSLMLQVDVAARTIHLVTPEKQERDCYAIEAVLVRPLARSSMQLRLQINASAAPSTRQLKFVSTEERDRCLRALERLRTSNDKSPLRDTEVTLMCDDGPVDVMETDPRVDAMAGEVEFLCVRRAERLVLTSEGECAFSGTLTTTNYRLVFSPDNETDAAWSFDVPRTAVDRVERDRTNVQLHFKDVRVVRLDMHDAFATTRRDSNSGLTRLLHDSEDWLSFWVAHVAPPVDVSRVFAFAYHQENAMSRGNGWLIWSPVAEYQRLGILRGAASKNSADADSITWRLLKNSKFRFSPTYPQLMVTPFIMTEDQLIQSARFRSRARLPIAVWRHPIHKCVLVRSSQPNYGLMGNQCDADRILLKAYRDAANKNNSVSSDESPPLRIIDARDLLSTTGNRVMGKGVEKPEHYDNAIIEFVGVANLHKMRESFDALKSLILSDGKNFHSRLQSTKWLTHLIDILNGARRVAQILHDDGASVLVHCSDGWNRTPQLVSLAQLMLDPYYRTIRGFAVLIEKEWCSFGHKFTDRIGVGKDASDEPNERSPVMLQFLDCVWQMMRQFPTAFEFNEKLLLHVWDALLSGLYGTFLYNNERERNHEKVWERTESVWTPVLENAEPFTNGEYRSTTQVLSPRADEARIVLWEAFFFRWDTA